MCVISDKPTAVGHTQIRADTCMMQTAGIGVECNASSNPEGGNIGDRK